MSEAITDTQGWRRNPGIEPAPLQDELMLYDPESKKFFVLNTTMAFLWERCDGEQSLQAIAQQLCDTFDGIDTESAAVDLRAALDEIHSLGLLVPAGAV